MKTVKFKQVPAGSRFIKKGITYIKKNNSVATCPDLFGKREVPFKKNIKVKIQQDETTKN